MPLRSRLVILLVGLLAVALIATDAITFSSLRGSLYDQAEQQLSQLWSQGPSCRNAPSNTYKSFYDAAGHRFQPLVCEFNPNVQLSSVPVPTVSRSLIDRAISSSGPVFDTVETSVPGTRDLVIAENQSGIVTAGPVFVVGIPLTNLDNTLAHQLHLDLYVSLAVLAVLALAAWALVRLSMRPLERMTKTAGEIAAGDLSARVEHTDERTEVGQLGAALNVMLTQIEEAFQEREESESRLRRFVADAAHELRTPLTSIRGFAELFRNGTANRPEDLAVALRRIEGESVRMAGLVEDLLLLARLDQGRPLRFEPLDLVQLADDAASDARAIDATRTVTVSGPDTLFIDGDEQRLRQVTANLVNNALAHTPSGTPIELLLGEEGDDARVSVIDHGPGIAAEDVSHVFERFWRADRSRKRSQQPGNLSPGAGLGLSIVAAIVSAHGGGVSVEPTAGGGATFVVRLPVHHRTGGEEPVADGSEDTTDSGQRPTSGGAASPGTRPDLWSTPEEDAPSAPAHAPFRR